MPEGQYLDATKVPQIQKFFEIVVDPLVQLMFAAAIVYFVYGVFVYFIKGDGSTDRTEGKSHILWSTVGLFIMISVWGIIAAIRNSFGIVG